MATLIQRDLKPLPEAEGLYRRWIGHLNEQFTLHGSPDRRAEIVRDELYQIYLGQPRGSRMNAGLTSELGTCVLTESFDCRNGTLQAEYLDGLDAKQFAPRKPLIWFWRMFDRSPLGENLWLGVRFRCMLGGHIFRSIGKGVKIHPDVRFTYGYNLAIEDNCRIRRGAVLDDGDGELLLPQGTIVEAGRTFSARGNG
jgi:acetyltransferase-like isoleucine patch superfamily enzyme